MDGGSGSTFVTETAPAEPTGRDATRPEWASQRSRCFPCLMPGVICRFIGMLSVDTRQFEKALLIEL